VLARQPTAIRITAIIRVGSCQVQAMVGRLGVQGIQGFCHQLGIAAPRCQRLLPLFIKLARLLRRIRKRCCHPYESLPIARLVVAHESLVLIFSP
jgi:hypothetical protein